jgi:hypothetical protein
VRADAEEADARSIREIGGASPPASPHDTELDPLAHAGLDGAAAGRVDDADAVVVGSRRARETEQDHGDQVTHDGLDACGRENVSAQNDGVRVWLSPGVPATFGPVCQSVSPRRSL